MRNAIFYIRTLVIGLAAGIHTVCLMAAPLPVSSCTAMTSQPLKPFASQLPESVSGYRLTGIRLDPLLQQQWAIVSSCDHPDGPSFMVEMHTESSLKNISHSQKPAKSPSPVVHTGDLIHVWSYEEFFRIETTGVAKENAALGDHLRVLLLQPDSNGFNSGSLRPTVGIGTIRAVVRGPHEVEIER
jgi:hypothetical protein